MNPICDGRQAVCGYKASFGLAGRLVDIPSSKPWLFEAVVKRNRNGVRSRYKLCSYRVLADVFEEIAMQRRMCVWLAACSVFAVAGSAWAGPTHPYPECTLHPSEADVTAAKGAFQAGTVSFNEADYDRAILYWEDAFRRDCTATLLLHHLGRAYEGEGNLEQAVIALRTFIERSPESPERAQIQRRIDVFEQKIAEEKQQAAARAQQPPAGQMAGGVPPSQNNNETAPNAPSQPPETAHKPLPWGPIIVTAAGGITTVVGALVYIKAKSDISSVESKCPNHKCPADQPSLTQQGNDARSRATTGTVVTLSGLVIAGAGVAWYFLDSKQSQQSAKQFEPPAISPWMGVGSAGVAWQGNF